jgi:hypothetical protein
MGMMRNIYRRAQKIEALVTNPHWEPARIVRLSQLIQDELNVVEEFMAGRVTQEELEKKAKDIQEREDKI